VRDGLPRSAQLVERVSAELAHQGVELPVPFDLETLRRTVERKRQRPLHMNPISLPAGASTVCGVCICTAEADLVFYGETISELHRTHNAVHELGHLLLGHRSIAALSRPSLGSAWAGSAQLTTSWLGNTTRTYGDQAEREADAVAELALGRWDDAVRSPWSQASVIRAGASRLGIALS
jgi:hypothetical protein